MKGDCEKPKYEQYVRVKTWKSDLSSFMILISTISKKISCFCVVFSGTFGIVPSSLMVSVNSQNREGWSDG